MLLRTLAGSRAGQIEDYAYQAGRNALAAGFAERLTEGHQVVTPEVRSVTPPVETDARPDARARFGMKKQKRS